MENSTKFEYLLTTIFKTVSKDFMVNISPVVWQQCEEIINELKQNDLELYMLLQEIYIENYRDHLRNIFEQFWPRFLIEIEPDKNNVNAHHRHIFATIENLFTFVQNWFTNPFIDILFAGSERSFVDRKTAYMEKLYNLLYSALIAQMPLSFSYFMLNTFFFSFKVFDYLSQNRKSVKFSSDYNQNCLDCGFSPVGDNHKSACYCESVNAGFIQFRDTIRRMGIFDRLCGDIIRSVIFTTIEEYIYQLCEDQNFDISCLSLTFNWLENNLTDWIMMVYLSETSHHYEDKTNAMDCSHVGDTRRANSMHNGLAYYMSHENIFNHVNVFSKVNSLSYTKLRNFIVNTFIYCRMKQLFDIVIDFPNSEAVLNDLHACIISDPFYRKKFINILKSSIERRLLHPGVQTSDIIDAYITAIKALKVLDPQGIILQIVCDPIRNYLKSREDTVRCIITSLTNENMVDLAEQADSIGNKEIKDDDDQVLDTWSSWHPQPIGVSKLNKALVNSDIISMLVNIFDSKDLFVQEYQRLLSQRLLNTFELNLEMEHRNLELLSLRFGESELHTCEVMLKDIKDSGRVNQRINSGEIEESRPKDFETNGIILSQQFWPENFGCTQSIDDLKTLKLPNEVREAFETYTKAFETIKANRTLNWIHQLGMVKLELELNNGANTIEFNVRPTHAAIIYQFQKRKIWRVSELAEELTLPPSVIRRHIAYWQHQSILVEVSPDTFAFDDEARSSSINSNQRNIGGSQEFDNYDVEITTDEQCKRSHSDGDDNRLQIFWNFIDNMLKNLSSLSLDRIFSMLKMFNMQSPEIESLTMHELRQFLDRKVREAKLVYVNGVYSLKVDDSISD